MMQPSPPPTGMKRTHDPSIILSAKEDNWQNHKFWNFIVYCVSDRSLVFLKFIHFFLAELSVHLYMCTLHSFSTYGKLSFSNDYPDDAHSV